MFGFHGIAFNIVVDNLIKIILKVSPLAIYKTKLPKELLLRFFHSDITTQHFIN